MRIFQRVVAWLKAAAFGHWKSLALLVLPITYVVWNSDADSVLPLLPLPIAAFFIGYLLIPRHVWIVWLGAVVIQWIAMGVLGAYGDPGPDETVGSLIIEAFFWMAGGVLLPLWLGRLAGSEPGETTPRNKRPTSAT